MSLISCVEGQYNVIDKFRIWSLTQRNKSLILIKKCKNSAHAYQASSTFHHKERIRRTKERKYPMIGSNCDENLKAVSVFLTFRHWIAKYRSEINNSFFGTVRCFVFFTNILFRNKWIHESMSYKIIEIGVYTTNTIN